MSKHILVVGGAGYIGSHTALALEGAGYTPVVFDNLSSGHREFLRWGPHVIADLSDLNALRSTFQRYPIDAVLHFAACAYVGESVENPEKYYANNVANTLNLLSVMREFGVGIFIFSSSCAVYGSPQRLPLTEEHARNPISPYGRTKLAVEWMLEDFRAAYGLKFTALRYFNAAGAAPQSLDARIGEWHEPETHLIPLVLQAALHPEKTIRIFGTDYDTPDGTCIRDYIHVCDLAEAHVLALGRLLDGGESRAFNLGNGRGFSVREVIECVGAVTGRPVNAREAPRRAGDPARLVGSSELARKELGWNPRYAELQAIVGSAWDWEQRREHVTRQE